MMAGPASIDPRPDMGSPARSADTDRRLAQGAAGMFALKVAYSALGFTLGIVLARLLGPSEFGSYAYAVSWAVFLGVPAALGLDKFVVREVAVYRGRGDWSHLRGLLRVSNRSGLVASAVLAGAGAAVAGAAWLSGHGRLPLAVMVGLLLVPVLTLMKVRQAALTGLGHVVQGQWPELLVHPLLLMALLAGVWVSTGAVSAITAVALTALSSATVLVLGAWLLRRAMPAEPGPTAADVILPWKASLLPLAVMGTIQMVQSQGDTLLLGLLASPHAVGLYSAAVRGSLLVNFFLMSAAPALGPVVASLHATGDRAGVERIVVRTARATLLLSLPVAAVLIVAGRYYLRLFGPQFEPASVALAILCIGQLVNVSCGPVGVVATMTGLERVAARTVGVAAAVNLALGAVLIPRWGLEGAAIGSATSMVVWNLLLVYEVQRRIGVHASVLGVLGHGRSRETGA